MTYEHISQMLLMSTVGMAPFPPAQPPPRSTTTTAGELQLATPDRFFSPKIDTPAGVQFDLRPTKVTHHMRTNSKQLHPEKISLTFTSHRDLQRRREALLSVSITKPGARSFALLIVSVLFLRSASGVSKHVFGANPCARLQPRFAGEVSNCSCTGAGVTPCLLWKASNTSSRE